jgi:hypothetical protein
LSGIANRPANLVAEAAMREILTRMIGLSLISVSIVLFTRLEHLSGAEISATLLGLALGLFAFVCGSCGAAALFTGGKLFDPDDSPRSHRHHRLERDDA